MHEFFALTASELRDMMDFLVAQRERLRDAEVKRLAKESRGLLARMEDLDRRKLAAELRCFRDLLALHKRSVEENGQPRR